MQHRLERVRVMVMERKLPALLISAPTNRRYLSGFTGTYGWLLITPTTALLFTDSRYLLQAGQQAPAFEVRQVVNPGSPFPTLLRDAVVELGLTQLGIEAAHMNVAEYRSLQKEVGAACELLPVEGMVETLREIKDSAEINTLKRAIALTDAAITAVIERLTPDTTERQAAWMLEMAMRVGGAEAVSFPIIVAAGPNAALPHATPGDAPLGTGQPIVIDMGARIEGYHADLTRTIVLGEPDVRFWEIYETVLKAQEAALLGLRPGLLTHEADALARDVIVEAGYGDHFGHGLGHGVGLDIHEGPGLRRENPLVPSQPLRAGMVTSIEPGIYLEGWGGVRIEDLALITDGGCEVLSQAPKLRR
ncbi:MAG: aminopeptidase P family protein [Chloroflexia bacterium]|nr:aminopeptidase P family protein [Chloroflexia bacterium]